MFTPVTTPAPTARRAIPSAWVRARAAVDFEDPVVGWASAIAVMLFSFFLRVWHLGSPHEFEFDETYYAKDAWSLAHFGYVRDYQPDANAQILDGHTMDQWKDGPSMIVHPEVGKWLIAMGEKAFGMDPFGWRIAAAVVGSLMILVMCRLARRITGSTALGLVAGLLLSFDGLQFVLSRLALLDIFVAFFVLCGVACLVNDRFWLRARIARLQPETVTGGGWGPVRRVLFRPWLLLGGICWGLALGSKWEAAYPLAAFGVLSWLWSAGARRSFGVRWPVLKAAVVDGIPAFVQVVLVAVLVYVASWTGWLIHAQEYETHLSATQYTHYAGGKDWPTRDQKDASGFGEVVQSLDSLAHYHRDVYMFHTHFLNDSTHTYASKPSGWLLLNRPVGVAADVDIKPGTQGCHASPDSDCLRQVLLIGTPAIWWAGILALLYAVATWVGGRDWRFGIAVVGTASTWLPWLQYDDRPIFLFYEVVTLPFVVLALTLAMGKMIGTSTQPSPRRTAGVIAAGSYFVIALINFAWFWPIFTNQLLTHSEWLDRIWFQRWV
ncbi:phospholipid carrier-dependent glycosyltransferase [Nocardioides sp. LS1]|nr:phospholipid carrier-dependent glycosyltransferase [Nocardioides sp. LS1]